MPHNGKNTATRDERFNVYLDHLSKLREDRVTLREVLEREILLGFIRTNRSSINEFPLLEMQQEAVIELMCQRLDHPAYDYIRKLSGNFVAMLGHYRKAVMDKDQKLLDKTTRLLANTEVLLIKCMQGIVYSMGLIVDNFEELIIRRYGTRAMDDFSEILKSTPMGTPFWKLFMDRFVALPVAQGHDHILEHQLFSLSKQGSTLVARFPMDAITSQMAATNAKLDKTRIQKAFETTVRDDETRAVLKLVHTSLSKGLSFIPEELLSKNDVESIARIVCIDSSTLTFRDAYQAKLQNKDTQTEEDRVQFKFLMDQVTAVGVGAAIGVSMTQQNLAAAFMGLVPGNIKAFTALGRNFRLVNIRRLLQGLLEEHFILRLHDQAGDDLSKLKIIKSYTRRAPAAQVAALGLSKIRLKKLFQADPADQAHFLFRPANDAELVGLVKLLQLEPEIANPLIGLWKAENNKTEILVLIDLALLQRTTTNLQTRVQEILQKLGLVSRASTTPASDAPTPTA